MLVSFAGCQNFSPRQRQEIDNRDGKINGEIDTMANSVKAEILKLQQNDEIQNSTLDRVQKGMLNLQNNYQNNGVQILSGPGGLIFSLVALFTGCFVALHYRKNAQMSEKASTILAQKIAPDSSISDNKTPPNIFPCTPISLVLQIDDVINSILNIFFH